MGPRAAADSPCAPFLKWGLVALSCKKRCFEAGRLTRSLYFYCGNSVRAFGKWDSRALQVFKIIPEAIELFSRLTGSRTGIITSVKTPLGFFALVALVVEAGLLLAGAPILVPSGLLALLVIAVVVIAFRRPELLQQGEVHRLTISLVFPGLPPYEVELNEDHCSIEVRDATNQTKVRGIPSVRQAPGGWVVDLRGVHPSDSVRLELVEHSGRCWRINPFTPYESTQNAVLKQGRE